MTEDQADKKQTDDNVSKAENSTDVSKAENSTDVSKAENSTDVSKAETNMRRKDRAVTDDAWLQVFLERAPLGLLATVHEGRPYVNSNLFVYDATTHSIIMHTAKEGRTRANIEANGEHVTFTVHEMGRLLPAPEALEFSVEYASIVAFGKARLIKDEAEAIKALEQLMAKYAPHLRAGHEEGADYRPPIAEELKRTSVFRIQIEAWTGKKKEADEHEGAYWYDERPVLHSVKNRPAWRGFVQAIQIAPVEGAPLQFPTTIEAVAGRGLIGDRNCAPTAMPTSERSGVDVTLIASEDVEALAPDGITLTPAETRRNIVTVGVPLNHLLGKRFRVGNAILEGVELCEPCDTLGRYTNQGAKLVRALVHRGGLRANVVRSGLIRKDSPVVPLEAVGITQAR